MHRSRISRGHAEAGVLILSLQLHVASEVPVETDTRFCGEARSRGDTGKTWERTRVDAQLAVAQGELECAEMTETSAGFESIARPHARICVLFPGEQDRALRLPGLISDSAC